MKTNKMKKVILFNAQSGALFGSFDSDGFNLEGVDKNLFLYKEVEMSESEFWYGDYETGRVYNNNETQVVTQQTLRDNVIKKIFSKYHYINQIKIISDMLKGFVPQENQTQVFRDMITFIDEARAEYHLQKEAYSSNSEMYIWIPDEVAEDHVSRRYEGLI